MKPLLIASCIAAAASCAAAAAATADVAADAASQPPRTAAPACPASAVHPHPHAPGGATSKLRHIPDEGDPCADSRGPARPRPPAASAPRT